MQDNWMKVIMELIGAVTPLIGTAEVAFSGKPGSGAAKKQLVIAGVTAGLNTVGLVKPGLINATQADAILQNVNILVDASVGIMNTVKLFEAPVAPVPPAA